MSCPQTDAIRRRLLSGAELGPDDARHVATCAACRRAVSEVERLDARLRGATASLAVEPIPPEAVEIDGALVSESSFAMPVLAGLAAAAVLVAVVVLAIGRAPVAVVPEPSASVSPSSASAQPSPSATPVATPAPTATPSVPQVDAHLVGPQEVCMDGTAGFAVRLPDGWYANRHVGNEPACRTIGTVRDVEGRQILDPIIYLSVADAPPELDPSGEIISDAEAPLPDGTTLRRLEVHVPESGAVASVDEVQYLATLRDQRTLLVTTDARDAAAVSALDDIMATLVFTDPIIIDPAVVDQAAALFMDRDVCVDPDRGLSVVFPDAWWTNTAVDDLPACSWFAPTSFEYVSAEEVPDEVQITVSIRPGIYGWGYEDPTSWDSITLFDRPGTRYVVGDEYAYAVQLGDQPEGGPAFTASTGSDPLSRAVLDQLMARMSFSTPPPGAESDEPDITAPPATAQREVDGFRLELTVDQERYRAGQPILADATLTYLGPDDSIRIWGSSMGPVFAGMRQLDGPIQPWGGATSDCVAREMARGEPLHVPFTKSGGFDGDDPLADWYEAYFNDALLRLPPGRWQITASAGGTLGGDDCGAGPGLELSVSVEVVVEP